MAFGLNKLHINSASAVQKGYGYLSAPLNVMWDVTNRCNLNCMHCYNGSGKCPQYEDLSDDEMRKVCRDIIEAKIPIVCFCGGEPLLRLSLIEELGKSLTSHNILVNMVSNGMLMNEEAISRLRNSGILNIQISLDSYTPEIHDRFRGCSGAHEKAIQAIQRLIKAGMEPEVTFIPTQLNYHEVDQVIEFVKSLGLKKLRSMPFIPIGRGYSHKDMLRLTREQLWEFYMKVHKKLGEDPDFEFDYGDPLEHIYLFLENNIARTITYEIRSNGDIVISPYLPYVFGNVKESSLKEMWEAGLKDIWKDNKIQSEVRKIISIVDVERQEKRPWNQTDILLYDKRGVV